MKCLIVSVCEPCLHILSYLGVTKVLLKAGKSVPTEYYQGIPGAIVLTKEYYSEVAEGDDTVLTPSTETSEVSGAAESRMTSTPNRVGNASRVFGAPVRPRQRPAAVSRIVASSVSSIRPNSPASGELADMSMSSDFVVLD